MNVYPLVQHDSELARRSTALRRDDVLNTRFVGWLLTPGEWLECSPICCSPRGA